MRRIARRIAALGLLLIADSASAADPAASYKATRAAAPADVGGYMDRRAGCLHWASEEPYDADRRAQINGALTKLGCNTIDADEAALRQKYAGQPAALVAIDLAKNGVE